MLGTPEEETSTLGRLPIRVDAVDDPVVGGEGKAISVPGSAKPPLFLFRGIPGLRAGQVASRVWQRELRPNDPIQVTLPGRGALTLELVCDVPSAQAGSVQVPARLMVRRGDRRQEIHAFPAPFDQGVFVGTGGEGSLRLLWSGDLNGDGRPDFILDLSSHYNIRMPTLFLSMSSGDAELVRVVAQQHSVGC